MIALGTNDLKIFRRHLLNCGRYPDGSKKPFTYKPRTKQEQKADTCNCPVWCYGCGDQILTVNIRTLAFSPHQIFQRQHWPGRCIPGFAWPSYRLRRVDFNGLTILAVQFASRSRIFLLLRGRFGDGLTLIPVKRKYWIVSFYCCD